MSTEDRDGPLDVEAAFAQIVSQLEAEARTGADRAQVHTWPASEDIDVDRSEPDRAGGPFESRPSEPGLFDSRSFEPDRFESDFDSRPFASGAAGSGQSEADQVRAEWGLPPAEATPEIQDDEAEDRDERYVPPEPPPLPRGDLTGRLAWGAVLGAPLFLLICALIWRDVPRLLLGLAVAAFVGGFVLLVARLPAHRDDDGDDGAVV